MKHPFYLLIGLVIVSSLVSCQKELSEENGNDPGAAGRIRMKIGGTQWVADAAATATIRNGIITITGTSADGKSLLIELDDLGAVSYPLGQQTSNYASVTDPRETNPSAYTTDEGQSAADAGGQVVITQIDQTNKTLSGTFSFKLYRDADGKQLEITEGIIESLPFTTDDPAPNPGGGTVVPGLSVKVDGVPFSPTNLIVQHQSPMIVVTGTQLSGTSAKIIILTIPQDVVPDDYAFGVSGPIIGVYSTGTIANPAGYQATSGTLTVTEHNTTTKVLKGTFSFVGTDLLGGVATATLTEGSFTAKY